MAPKLDDVLLTPETYAVLKRVPEFWFDELAARREIAAALESSALCVGKRFDYLRKAGLIERRRSPQIEHQSEIRRVAKE